MIHEYRKTFLNNYFDYNNSQVGEIADNLFEKMRQLGILPAYLERSKVDRAKIDLIDQSVAGPIFVAEPNFTFGYAYKGTQLLTEGGQQINLGKVYDFEFELVTKAGTYFNVVLLENFIIASDLSISVHGVPIGNVPLDLVGKVVYFHFSRVNESVSLYINKEHINTVEVADEATIFNIVYKLTLVADSETVFADSETVFANSTRTVEVDGVILPINDFFERENERFTELYSML